MQRLGLEAIVVSHISIKMPNGDNILSDNMLLGQIVALKDKEMTIDLIVFEVPNFNMILGMEFLSRYEAEMTVKGKMLSLA